jgi:hypothetical protein
MFSDEVVIGDRTNHLYVELFLVISESWFEDNEIVAVVIGLKVNALCESGHLTSCEVNSSLDFSSTVTELEHVGVVLSMAVLKSGHNGDSVELLSVKGGIIFQLVINLVDRKRNYCLVIHRLVLFLIRVHSDLH